LQLLTHKFNFRSKAFNKKLVKMDGMSLQSSEKSMKPIQTAVVIIALTGAFEFCKAESVFGYTPKSFSGQQLELSRVVPVAASTNLLENGLKKQEQEDYTGAIIDYTEFLKTYPIGGASPVENRLEAYSNRGFSKAMIEDLSGAIVDFDRAIELAPHSADAHNGRGNVNAMAGNLTASIRDFNRAIRCDRSFADAYYNRAISRHSIGDRPGAKSDLSRAAKLFQQQKDIGGYQQAREWIDKLK
jgi:tetratricopeptide (TPR) repeat protein